MKLPIQMVNRYLSKPLNLEEIVAALARTEIEVEEILTSGDFDNKIITGEVVKLIPHPNADKLKIANVRVGGKKDLQIVCGAPNIAIGQKVALASVGATLPDGLVITARKLRGAVSHGMVCSEAELGISDDHSGIMVLDHSTPVGKKLCDVWPRTEILDIKTHPNRWDHNSVVGISREIATYTDLPDISLKQPKFTENTYHEIQNENVKKMGKCGRLIFVKMRVKQNATSPQWLVENLQASGLRSIHPVVDITNYVTLEYGQPSHAYDAAKIKKDLTVRFASPTESLVTIDGESRKLTEQDMIIADSGGPVALAGVMGGQHSEVDESTHEILLEVAQFDKTVVRKTAQRHGLRTEASARFERGLPLPLSRLAADRLISLFSEICGAELVNSPTDELYGWPWVQYIGLSVRRAERLLGIPLDESEVAAGLKKLGFSVEHFSWSSEAKKYLGKPYKFGASFKKDGETAFDCSYLTERIYSKIGVMIGHTAQAQYENGQPVDESDLKPGDLVFYSGNWERLKAEDRGGIGHNGVYIGKNKVLESVENKYNFKTRKYEKLASPGVRISPLSDFVNNPSYKGARRYVDNFNHILAVTAPWWRTDIKLSEDLVEEIIKLIGYANLPPSLPQLPPQNDYNHQLLPNIMKLRRDIVAIGLTEVMTYSMVSAAAIKQIKLKTRDHYKIANPLSVEQEYLRSTMLSSFLNALASNLRYDSSIGIFELSKVFSQAKATTPIDEKWKLAFGFRGDSAASQARALVYWLSQATRTELLVESANSDWFDRGLSAEVKANNQIIGQFGQVSVSILPKELQESAIWYGEITIEGLLAKTFDATAPKVVPYQLVKRDVTLQGNHELVWAQVKQAAAKLTQISNISFNSDYYAGNQKTINLTIWYDLGPNPTSIEIDTRHKNSTSQLAKTLSATIS